MNEDKPPQIEKLFACLVRGIIALETGHSALAYKHLDTFFSLGRNFWTPTMQRMQLETNAYYGLALVAIGNAETAEKHFKLAYPILIANGETDIIARCGRARKIGH